MHITLEQPAHAGAIETLLNQSFGPKRSAKTVYRLRRGVAPVASLNFVAIDDAGATPRLVATVRNWPILIGGKTPALLLGPIAVDEAWRSTGIGSTLMRHCLAAAKAQGHRIVILVGDEPYYQRFGFSRGKMAGLTLPGPVDLARLLGLELVPGALDGVSGPIGRAPAEKPARASARRRKAA